MKELIKISCYRCNSHVGSAVSYFIAVHRLNCSLMISSVTGRLQLDVHHTKANFENSEDVQPLCVYIYIYIYIYIYLYIIIICYIYIAIF